MIKIKTLEDIAKRNDLRILLRHSSSLVAFAENDDSELAMNIKNKLDFYFDYYRENIETKLSKGLIGGTIAYIQEYFNAVQTLPRIHKIKKLFSMVNLHISTESAGYEPYFILVNQIYQFGHLCSLIRRMYFLQRINYNGVLFLS